MTEKEMLASLVLAAQQCSDIYYYARHDADTELEHLMSAIDTCLHEAMDLIEARK